MSKFQTLDQLKREIEKTSEETLTKMMEVVLQRTSIYEHKKEHHLTDIIF